MTPDQFRFFNQTNSPRYAAKSGPALHIGPVHWVVKVQLVLYPVAALFMIWGAM